VACGRDRFETRLDAAIDAPADVPADLPFDADPLTVGLVSHFDFDGTLTDGVTDTVATCPGGNCPTFVPGKHGMAVAFDGTSQCLQFDSPGNLGGPNFSVALWLSETTDGRWAIISKPFNAATTDNDSWQLETDTVNTFGFSTANAGRHDYMWLYGAVTQGAWQHIALTWDGNLKRIYLNGSLAEALADADPVQFDTTAPLIGCDLGYAALGYYFPGAVDEVRVYARTLSDAEVMALAQ